jgi:hypothetical protein
VAGVLALALPWAANAALLPATESATSKRRAGVLENVLMIATSNLATAMHMSPAMKQPECATGADTVAYTMITKEYKAALLVHK